jgi:hypothetical protein
MGAIFDTTGKYRYRLWREWDAQAPKLAFIMLNPSTADAEKNDPTIRRCIGFARAWGYGAIEVVNLFAYRATDPQELRAAAEPIGKENDRHLLAAMERSQTLILAWGNWGSLYQRDQAVLRLLSQQPVSQQPVSQQPVLSQQKRLYCLGKNQSGQPRHPLYLKRTVTPSPFDSPGSTPTPALRSSPDLALHHGDNDPLADSVLAVEDSAAEISRPVL